MSSPSDSESQETCMDCSTASSPPEKTRDASGEKARVHGSREWVVSSVTVVWLEELQGFVLSSLWHNDTVPSESVTAMMSALFGCHSRSRTSVSVSLICLLLVCSSFSAVASNAKNSREPVEVATQSVDPSFDSCGVHSMSSTAESKGTVCTCALGRLSV